MHEHLWRCSHNPNMGKFACTHVGGLLGACARRAECASGKIPPQPTQALQRKRCQTRTRPRKNGCVYGARVSGATITAYVWGNQLIRQTQGGACNLFATANAANDVFPLQGQLNTSLGALDANGTAIEQSLADAFGQLDTPTGLKQNHLFTGEYWDHDSQLLYLRARWYNPRIGRFVSADPFEGKQRDSRSLNRYVYASSDVYAASH